MLFILIFIALRFDISNYAKPPDIQPVALHEQNTDIKTENADSQVSKAPLHLAANALDEHQPTGKCCAEHPYDPREDTAYRTYLWATIAGVAGGFIGIFILICQSILLRRSVEAAHKGADALMDSEGAVLKIDEGALGINGAKSRVSHRIHNIGRTIATIITAEQAVQLGASPDSPPNPSLYEETEISIPSEFYLPAGEHTGVTNYLSDRSGLTGKEALGTLEQPVVARLITDEEYTELTKRTKTLWSYGFVRYRDVFKRVYELRYCQRFEPNMAMPPNFIVAGPPEFNRLTRYIAKEKH
jgi:hypothetical protein